MNHQGAYQNSGKAPVQQRDLHEDRRYDDLFRYI